jgi:hypothetical protein
MSLPELIHTLAQRDAPRSEATIQSLVHQLLVTGGFDLADEQVALETQVGDRRRIDVEVGATVIEVKRDLRVGNVLADAIKQLKGYVEKRQETFARRYVGILTDGCEWRCFHLVGDQLVEVSAHTTFASNAEDLVVWLDGVLATLQHIQPTPEQVKTRLGAGSSAHALDRATLRALYDAHKNHPGVKIKRRLWAKLLETALGTQFQDSDDLFIEHTLLVNSAEIIAHAVLGLRPQDIPPISLLSGEKFDEAGIFGVVEADFFDWVVDAGPAGTRFVRTLAHRLGRFEWTNVEHDVLKVLYESVIGAETRKTLGEYYTPDWLAERVVAEVVAAPLDQRVLDPSCGSGTFVFHAVRRHLRAAAEKKLSLNDTLAGVTRNVLAMDLHPVAVTLARVTYVLAIGLERLRSPERTTLQIPVYLADSMQWHQADPSILTARFLTIAVSDQRELFTPEFRFPSHMLADGQRFDALVKDLAAKASARKQGSPPPSLSATLAKHAVPEGDQQTITDTFKTMCRLHDEDRDHIWGYYIRNLARPEVLSGPANRVDVLVGNPPWLSYRFMSKSMQADFRKMSEGRGMWHGGRLATQQDLSTLFIARATQLYLKDDGKLAFVVPNAVLDRAQYAGFRSGELPDRKEPAHIAFSTPWNLRAVRPHFFPYACAVIFGARAKSGVPMPDAIRWTGKLRETNAPWRDVEALLKQHAADEAPGATASVASVYAKRFRNGATIFPRVLFMVERLPPGPLGYPAGKVPIRSTRSSTEKPPWKGLVALEGVVESEFVRPVHLGETILPFRPLGAVDAVIPRDSGGLLATDGDRIDEYPGLAKWWRAANDLWMKHRSSDRLTLTQQLDYHNKLSTQFPIERERVVYSKSGMHLAAARLTDHRAVIDHKLYWATVRSTDEAHYLCAIMNAAVTTRAVRPLMSYGKDERDIDKVIWKLAIPEFDSSLALHQQLAALGAKAEAGIARIRLPHDKHFAAQRRVVRTWLERTTIGREIEAAVARLLDVEYQAEPLLRDEVYSLVAKGSTVEAVRRVFGEIDDRILAGELSECDAELRSLDLNRVDITTALAFLAITLPVREKLPSRAALVERIEAWLRERAPERVEALIGGLR